MKGIKNAIEARYIQQGYLADNDNCEIRVTVRENNSFICIKSAKCEFSRDEFDYKIPDEEAKELLDMGAISQEEFDEIKRKLNKLSPSQFAKLFSEDKAIQALMDSYSQMKTITSASGQKSLENNIDDLYELLVNNIDEIIEDYD